MKSRHGSKSKPMKNIPVEAGAGGLDVFTHKSEPPGHLQSVHVLEAIFAVASTTLSASAASNAASSLTQ